jgi:hypothetical protein
MLGVDLAALPLSLLAASSGPRLAKFGHPSLQEVLHSSKSLGTGRAQVSVQAGHVLANLLQTFGVVGFALNT